MCIQSKCIPAEKEIKKTFRTHVFNNQNGSQYFIACDDENVSSQGHGAEPDDEPMKQAWQQLNHASSIGRSK